MPTTLLGSLEADSGHAISGSGVSPRGVTPPSRQISGYAYVYRHWDFYVYPSCQNLYSNNVKWSTKAYIKHRDIWQFGAGWVINSLGAEFPRYFGLHSYLSDTLATIRLSVTATVPRAGLSQSAALFQLSLLPLFLLSVSAPLLPFRSSPLHSLPPTS